MSSAATKENVSTWDVAAVVVLCLSSVSVNLLSPRVPDLVAWLSIPILILVLMFSLKLYMTEFRNRSVPLVLHAIAFFGVLADLLSFDLMAPFQLIRDVISAAVCLSPLACVLNRLVRCRKCTWHELQGDLVLVAANFSIWTVWRLTMLADRGRMGG